MWNTQFICIVARWVKETTQRSLAASAQISESTSIAYLHNGFVNQNILSYSHSASFRPAIFVHSWLGE